MFKSSDNSKELITCLDIGSTKISMVVAKANSDQSLEIIASEHIPNSGLVKGTVVDIEATTTAISDCIKGLEEKCGTSITPAWVGISGEYIKSYDSKTTGLVHNSEIKEHDVDRLIKEARVVSAPQEKYQVIHVVPKSFMVDEQSGITNPISMYGHKIEMDAHIIASRNTATKNILKCCSKAGLKVESLVLSQLASGVSVLGEDEKRLGVALVDVGGGTSKILIYVKGMLVYTHVIPIGGVNITNDIAVGLRTPQKSAEKLKCQHGCAMPNLVVEEENVEIEGIGGRQPKVVSNTSLSEIIEPRAEEILGLINNAIKKSGFIQNLGSGVVLTGGCSSLEGFVEMAEFLFDMPVRKGVPTYIEGMSEENRLTSFATGIGLIMHGHKNKIKNTIFLGNKMVNAWKRIKNFVSTVG